MTSLQLLGNTGIFLALLVSNWTLNQNLSLSLLYSEVHEQLGLESSWVTCEKSRQSITCPVCTFVPITTVIQMKHTHTHTHMHV